MFLKTILGERQSTRATACQPKVFTKPNRPMLGAVAGALVRAAADALEDAIWSAQRETGRGYGIAVFDLDPEAPGGKTSITINYYQSAGRRQGAESGPRMVRNCGPVEEAAP